MICRLKYYQREVAALRGRDEQIAKLTAENEKLREAAQKAVDATDKARNVYGGAISFDAAVKLDKLTALLQEKSDE